MVTHSPSGTGQHARGPQGRSPAVQAVGIVVGLTVALAILLLAFALPAVKSAPRDVPIGVAGPAPVVAKIEAALEKQAPGGFVVTAYPDQDAMRTAIRNREVYGGFTVGQGPAVSVASGGSPMIAQMLTQIGSVMAQQGVPLQSEDLAPMPENDPRGIGLAAAALPMTLAGLVPAIVLFIAFPRQVWLQAATMVAFAGVVSLTVTLLLRYVFGSVEQNFWGVTAGLFLGCLATGLAVLGLGSLFGKAGLAVGALVIVLLGNPLSGMTAAPELLPSGWGALGQLLPPGANATLLRSTAYFSGAGAGTAVMVLCGWVLAGVALIAIAAARSRRQTT